MKKLAGILAVICGNVLLAFGIAAFLEPTGIISGGTTGIGLFVQEFFGLPVSVTYGVVNVVCFLLGLLILGKEFAMSTLLSTVIFPFILGFFENVSWLSSLTDDYFLAAVLAGTLSGTGVGLVIRFNASTGGMDIPPLILQKKFRIPVSFSLWIFDLLILLMQTPFHPLEDLLYGIILTLTVSTALNKVLLLGTSKTQVKIISRESNAIRNAILSQVDRGVTLLHGEGGYSRQPAQVLLSVVSNHELPRLEALARAIDPECFIIVSRVTEVWGRGFTLSKHSPHTDRQQRDN